MFLRVISTFALAASTSSGAKWSGFFCDVVSARDMREFLLPSFDIMRIPQWAVRAEYSKYDIHAEVLWIPVPTLDDIGKPGADYYPGPFRGTASYLNEDRSGRNVGNSN